MGLVKQIIRGSFVSFAKMTQEPDEHATRPDREHAEGYVNQRRDEHTSKLIEFTSDDRLAAIFAAEARFSYVFTVQIKRKYLTKGSHGEKGWMAKQSAPFKISRVERKDSTKEGGAVPLSDAEFHDAVEKERIAELLHSIRETDGLVAYMKQFTSQADKVAAAKRINDYWKQLSGE